jgi:hypothetical protein
MVKCVVAAWHTCSIKIALTGSGLVQGEALVSGAVPSDRWEAGPGGTVVCATRGGATVRHVIQKVRCQLQGTQVDEHQCLFGMYAEWHGHARGGAAGPRAGVKSSAHASRGR